MAADLPSEEQVAPLVLARHPVAHDLKFRTVDADAVALLNKHTTGDRSQLRARWRGAIVRRGEDPHLLLRGENLQRRRLVAGRDQDLNELFAERRRRSLVNDPVQRDHAAVSADRITGEGLAVGLEKV